MDTLVLNGFIESKLPNHDEHLHLAKMIGVHVSKYPDNDLTIKQLLGENYEYFDAFTRIIENGNSVQLAYLCQQIPGFDRFVRIQNQIVERISSGIVYVPESRWGLDARKHFPDRTDEPD